MKFPSFSSFAARLSPSRNDAAPGARARVAALRLVIVGIGLVCAAGCTTGVDKDEKVPAVVINEICPSNASTAVDNFGGSSDWIELYNPGDEAVDLTGWYISDHESAPTRFAMPSLAPLEPKALLVLWADDDLEQTNLEEGEVHLPFKLFAAGEGVYLTSPGGNLVDGFLFSGAVVDQSYGRYPDGTGEFAWCTTPSPWALNGSTCPEEGGAGTGGAGTGGAGTGGAGTGGAGTGGAGGAGG